MRGLHQEYELWMSELRFYQEELSIFAKYVGATSRCREELCKALDQCRDQNEVLQHKLHRSEKALVSLVHQMSGMGTDDIHMDNHMMLRKEMTRYRESYRDLKKGLRQVEPVSV